MLLMAAAVVLTHVAVVGPEGVVPDQSIVVSGNRIVDVGPAATLETPADARVVDLAGAFAIPGLWEMHAHLASYPGALPLLVAYGVTGARDMGNATPKETADLVKWRGEIAAQKRVGPRLVIAGPTLDGPRGSRNDARLYVTTAAEGRAAVATALARGADFVKVHDWVGPEAYKGIVAAARAAKVPVVGHTPAAIAARDVSEAGQRSIEHLGSAIGGFLLEASRDEKAQRREILQQMDAARKAGSEEAFWKWAYGPAHVQALLDGWNDAKAAALIQVFRKNHTWQCPTLTVLSPSVRPRSEAEGRFVFASARAACVKTPPAGPGTAVSAAFERKLRVVADMQRAGVPLLTGTDVSAPNAEAVEEFATCDVPLPGLSVHDELEWLVTAGLTPAQALTAATLEPARYFGEEREAGRIAAGQRADIVLLAADPLADIRNTRQIRAVMAAGQYFDRATLDGFLEQAAADAQTR